MNTDLRKKIDEWFSENYPEETILFPDGLEEAFMGVCTKFNVPSALFDTEKVIEILMNSGMSYEEAVEYFEFNIEGAYVGESTPSFFQKFN